VVFALKLSSPVQRLKKLLRISSASSRSSAGAPVGSVAIDRRRFSTSLGDDFAEPASSLVYRGPELHLQSMSSEVASAMLLPPV
jgi:hypothetical protein